MTDRLTNSPRIRLRKSSVLRDATGLQMIVKLDPGSSWVWIASQFGVTQKAAHGRYGKISPPAWERRCQPIDEPCRLELSHDLTLCILT
jgi:hypothetical protein